jgi:hypothetical protein
MGKTQLASEFVHRYGSYFAGGVFWLSFADAEAVPAEIDACRTALGQEVPLNMESLPPSTAPGDACDQTGVPPAPLPDREFAG